MRGPGGEPEAIVLVGLSHHSAPIEIRERFTLGGDRSARWIDGLLEKPHISQCVVLSTCNRTECYAAGRSSERIRRTVIDALVESAGVDGGERFLVHRSGYDVVRHLFRVTAGLDSLVVGEPQIQGQVSQAYHESGDEALGPSLHRLFQSALAAGGRVRSSTAITRGTASIPSAAVGLAKKVFGTLEGRAVMVIGTGEMGRLTVQCLRAEGVARTFVASRSLARAERAARDLHGIPITREAVRERLPDIDLLVTASDEEAAFVTPALFEGAHEEGRPTVILDIAVPRNVRADTGDLAGIFLYNVDDLQRVVERVHESRSAESEVAEHIVEHHARKFWTWYRSRAATPAIRQLRGAARAIVGEALEGRPPGPRDEDRERELRLASRGLLNKILHGPTRAIRHLAEGEEDEYAVPARLASLLKRGPEASGSDRIAEERGG